MFFPGFADEARCKRIVEIASKRLAPSSLALRAGDTAANTADIRTSQGTFLTRHDDGGEGGVLDWLEKRIASVTMLPQRHGEPFNVLRYEVGQKYDSHYDTFDPESYGPQSRRAPRDSQKRQRRRSMRLHALLGDASDSARRVRSQRLASFLLYLNEWEEGCAAARVADACTPAAR